MLLPETEKNHLTIAIAQSFVTSQPIVFNHSSLKCFIYMLI